MANTVTTRFNEKGARQVMSQADKLNAKVKNLQKTTAKGFITGVGAGAAIGAMNLAGQAIRGVTGYLQESAEAFREDEVSAQKLNTAIRANTDSSRDYSAQINDQLKAGQALGFSDDAQRSSLAELVGAYGGVTKALQVMRTAQDLARFSGVDLATASDTLIKVHAGNFRALKSLGINTKDIKTEQQALAAIMKVASGQAEDYAKTLSGRLAVAEEKAAEASEKFGKQVARLQAEVIPFATDIVADMADGFDDLGTMADKTAPPVDRLDAAVDTLKTSVLGQIPIVRDWLNAMGNGIGELNHLRVAADLTKDDIEDLGAAVGDLPGAFGSTEDAIRNLTDAEKLSIDKTRKFVDTLERIEDIAGRLPDALDDVTEALFGVAQSKGDLGEARQELADLLAEPPGAKAGTRAWNIYNGKVAEAKQRIFELQFEMKKTEGPEALDDWLRKSRDALGKTDQKARDYFNTLIAINSINLVAPNVRTPTVFSTKRKIGGGYVPLAEGGIVPARPGGTLALLGEGGHDEAVVPLNKGGGMGGSTTININVSTPALTPGGAESLARYLEPIITRAQQRRGLVGAARAF